MKLTSRIKKLLESVYIDDMVEILRSEIANSFDEFGFHNSLDYKTEDDEEVPYSVTSDIPIKTFIKKVQELNKEFDGNITSEEIEKNYMSIAKDLKGLETSIKLEGYKIWIRLAEIKKSGSDIFFDFSVRRYE